MRPPFRHARRAGLLAVLLLAACAGAPERRGDAAPAAAAAAFPHAFYEHPPGEGRVYRVDASRSELQVLVFRAGALARRGHNHLVRATAFEGAVFLATDVEASRMDLQVPVRALEVDPEAQRASAGAAFAAAVDADARAGTRGNLLGPRVLDAGAHPFIAATARVAGGELPWLVLELTLTVRGHPHRSTVPVRVELDGEQLRARGMLALRHAELGLEPFTALGGLLAVADPIILRFDLLATASPAP